MARTEAERQEAIKEKISPLVEGLYFPRVKTLADFEQQVAEFKAAIAANKDPLTDRNISPADASLFQEALTRVEGSLRPIFRRADTYTPAILAKVEGKEDPFISIGDIVARLRQKLIEDNGDIPIDKNWGISLAAQRVQDEFISRENNERQQSFGYLGREVWDGYKQYRAARLGSTGTEDQIVNDTRQLLEQGGWTDPDLEQLYQRTWDIEQKIRELETNIAAGNATDLAGLQQDLEAFQEEVQVGNTGATASEVLHARLQSQLDQVLRNAASQIGPEYLDRSQRLFPADQETYSSLLQSLRDLEAVLNKHQKEGKSFLNLTPTEREELERLQKAVEEKKNILTLRQIPEFDKNHLSQLVEKFINQSQVLLGEEVDETEDVFTPDVTWWMSSNYGNAWRSTQRLVAQFESGGAIAFMPADMRLIEKNLEVFIDALGDLVEQDASGQRKYDTALALRLAAIDIQINRLTKLKKKIEAGAPKPEINHAEISEGVIKIYELLQSKNVSLPDLEKLGPENAKEFFRELSVAIFDIYSGLLDALTASGGGGFPFPNKVELWTGKNVSVEGEFPRNFEFFFENFPYYVFFPGLEKRSKEYQELRGEIIELYKYRLFGLENNQNLAADYPSSLNELQKPDNRFLFAQIAADRSDKGGYFAWDQKPLHNRFFEGKPLERIFGKEEETWLVGEYINFFVSRLEYHQKKGRKFIPIKFGTTVLKRLKRDILSEVPKAVRYEGDEKMLNVAWHQALFVIEHTNKLFGYDNSGLDTKMGRVLAHRAGLDWDDGYASKIQEGSIETTDRITETLSVQLERVGVDRERFIHVLVELTDDMYDTLTFDEYEALMPYEAMHLKIISPQVESRPGKPAEKPEEAAAKKYRIIKIRPEFSSLESDLGMPIAIPETFFDYAKNVGHPTLIPVYLSQVRHSMLDTRYIKWESLTPNHQGMYGSAVLNFSNIYEGFADYKGPCKMTDVNRLVEEKVDKKKYVIPAFPKLDASFRQLLRSFGVGSIKSFNYSLENWVHVREISRDEVALTSDDKVTLGLGTGAVVQKVGKYAFGEMAKCGPLYPDRDGVFEEVPELKEGESILDQNFENQMVIINIWEDIYRSLSTQLLHQIEHQAQEENWSLDKKKKAKTNAMRTPIHPVIRRVIDNFQEAYKIADDKKRKEELDRLWGEAERSTIVIAFMIAFRSYLERYRFEKADAAITLDVEGDYKLVKTISDWKPLTPETRKLLRSYFIAQMSYFDAKDFKGDFQDLPIYDENYFDSMLESLGLVGTKASFVVDRWWWREKHVEHNKNKKS